MIGEPLIKVIDKLLIRHPDATILVDGNSLCGDFAPFIRLNRGKFIFVRDYMGTGTAAPEILSPEFIALRVRKFNDPQGKKKYSATDYEWEVASALRVIPDRKGTEVIFVQFDCHLSQMWQLTMQAYIEQSMIADHITRIVFCEKHINKSHSEWICTKYDTIPVARSHEAYCQLICQHKKMKLSHFFISSAAVKSYLDVNASNGKLAAYIRNVSSTFDNPFFAAGRFLRDFPRLGLGDMDFLRIAYYTLEKDEEYQAVAKQWGLKLQF